MSKKVFKTVGKIAGVVAGVALVASGIGSALGGTMLFTAFGASIAASTIATVAGVVSLGASMLSRPKAPATSNESTDRLSVSMDPRTPRKFVLGRTAMATDIRDQEFSNNQEYLHRFVVTSSHKASAIEEIWFDDKKAWSSSGGVTSDFAGYLTVTPILEGSAANAINLSARMGATRRYTGLSYVYFRFKLTGNSKKAESPFAQSIPTRVTIIGKGAPTYDPRLDSTVAGGSGAHRAADQTTWAWNDAASRNPALQLLWYLLGWRIKNPTTNEWRLAVGKGIPAARIDLASFITAANLCDEPVTLAAGGTQPRYRSDGVFSEADATGTVLDQLKAAMNAELDDVDGKIRITVLHNDLATPIADFNDDDILGGFTWDQTAPLDETYNVVRGTFIDPSTTSLYQAVDFPEVRIDSLDGIDRIETVDFQTVQDASQAQRLVKQRIARMLYSGRFTATFSYRAWKVQKNDVIRLTFGALGWTNKLFRVIETAVQVDGQVPMVLQVENADIYLWDRDDRPAIQPVQPTSYDPYLNPIYQDVVEPKYADGTVIDVLRPAEPGATNGASPAEKDLLAQLDEDIEQAEANIAAAQETIVQMQTVAAETKAELEADIASINATADQIQADAAATRASLATAQADIIAAGGRIDTIETTLGDQNASITSLAQTVSNHTGRLASIDTTLSANGASINQNAQAISAVQGDLATLSSTVSTQGASISQNAQAITTANQSIASLTTRVSSAESSISSQSSAITSLQGSVATLTTRINAANPNLLKNGGFENGMANWSVTNGGPFTSQLSGSWGTVARTTSNVANGAYIVIVSDLVSVYQVTHTLSAESAFYINGGTGVGYTEIIWYASNGTTELRHDFGPQLTATYDFTLNGEGRRLLTWSIFPPAGAALARVVLTARKDSGTLSSLDWRQIKLEASTVATPYSSEAQIVQTASAVSTLNGSVATLSSTVSTQGASITSLQTASTNQAGQIASMQTTIGTQGSTITQQGTAISTLQGNYSSLSSTVSAQGSTISSQATAISNLQGRASTLETRVSAGTSPNLIANGSFENGLSGWADTSGWGAANANGWGYHAVLGSNVGDGSYTYITSARAPVYPNSTYTASGDLVQFINGGTGYHYIELLWFNSAGTYLSTTYGPTRAYGYDFDASGASRQTLKVTGQAPANAAFASVRATFFKQNGTANGFGARQMKLERGTVASAYSTEASVALAFSALSTLNSQYASLSSTVSTQGVTISSQQTAITTINNNVTTLYGRAALTIEAGGVITGWEVNNNGTTGDIKLRADRVSVVTAAGGTKTFEIRQGTIIGYYSNSQKMYQLGDQAVV